MLLSPRGWLLLVAALGFRPVLCQENSTALRHPYAVLVRVALILDCSGVIIHSRWILSSAQCYRSIYTSSFAFAGLDEYDLWKVELEAPGQSRELFRIYRHPQSDGPTKDLMLGLTVKPWTFSAFVQYLVIDFKDTRLKNARQCRAVSLGGSPVSALLQERPVSRPRLCTVLLDSRMLCASFPGALGPRDRGGPLVCGGRRLYGLLTNDTDDGGGVRGYFTPVALHADWMGVFVDDLPGLSRRSAASALQPARTSLLGLCSLLASLAQYAQ